jgi:ubiquinone/menaquinone biosynthesis C-methylase UbiE
LGAWLSGESEYRYLHESIAAFPAPGDFLEHMEAAGFSELTVRAMMMDVAHLYVARV